MTAEIAADLATLADATNRLRTLADYHDLLDRQSGRVGAGEVQADLREWAGAIQRLRRNVPALLAEVAP